MTGRNCRNADSGDHPHRSRQRSIPGKFPPGINHIPIRITRAPRPIYPAPLLPPVAQRWIYRPPAVA